MFYAILLRGLERHWAGFCHAITDCNVRHVHLVNDLQEPYSCQNTL